MNWYKQTNYYEMFMFIKKEIAAIVEYYYYK